MGTMGMQRKGIHTNKLADVQRSTDVGAGLYSRHVDAPSSLPSLRNSSTAENQAIYVQTS
jgi:hypothetical protein